jgi:hypothetical protein
VPSELTTALAAIPAAAAQHTAAPLTQFASAVARLAAQPIDALTSRLWRLQWFTYRYLLFKPDRAELKAQITKLTDSILG